MAEEDDNKSRQASVWKNKEEHKKEVNRLKAMKYERKMKMKDRADDIIPSPATASLSVESFCQDADLANLEKEGSTDGYLNGLLEDPTEAESSPQNFAECGGTAVLLGIVVTFFAALYFKK